MRIFMTLMAMSVMSAMSAGFLAAQDAATNLLANGSFQIDADQDGWPDNWSGKGMAEVVRADGVVWLKISRTAEFTQTLNIPTEIKSLTVAGRMRVTDVKVGEKTWQNARVVMEWKDADNKHVDPWPAVVDASGDSEWTDFSRTYTVPPTATQLRIGPALFAQGTAEFANLSVSVAERHAARENIPRPRDVPNTGDLSQAWQQQTAQRQSWCLNGVWQFQPDLHNDERPPRTGWTWMKVPGVWPRVYRSWERNVNATLPTPSPWIDVNVDWATQEVCWYQRSLIVPKVDAGKRLWIEFQDVQTFAQVWIDDVVIGSVQWPGGRVDCTAALSTSSSMVSDSQIHTLSVRVMAKPLALQSTVDLGPGRSFVEKGEVTSKGLVGDVYLQIEPAAVTVSNLRIRTTDRELTAHGTLMHAGQATVQGYMLGVCGGETVRSPVQKLIVDAEGAFSLTTAFPTVKLWDLHTPKNQYQVSLVITDGQGKVLDATLPQTIGFRNFITKGRDFWLNGSRVALRAVVSGHISAQADVSSRAACDVFVQRIKSLGFNAVITGNYNCKPGVWVDCDAFYEACDDGGILVVGSMPHAGDYGWQLDDPVVAQRYADLATWVATRVGHHPSVVMWSMNHNSTGYEGDQNPLALDSSFVPERDAPARSNMQRRQTATQAEDIVKGIDPGRPVYHHQSGNLGDVYSINTYLNWSPRQERNDWLQSWSTNTSSRPLFLVEWGLPHIASWSSYRGPSFIWRTEAEQTIWDCEFAAIDGGEAVYRNDVARLAMVKHEQRLVNAGKSYSFGYLVGPLRQDELRYTGVQAAYAAENWPAMRTWGISAMLPWDQENLWRDTGIDAESIENPQRWVGLQQPGLVPDYLHPHRAPGHWSAAAQKPSALGKVFERYNQPCLVYLGGHPDHVTEHSRNVLPGESWERTIVFINESRQSQPISVAWTGITEGSTTLTAAIGQQAHHVISGTAPQKPGVYSLALTATLADGSVQTDQRAIQVIAAEAVAPVAESIKTLAIYDPRGDTNTDLQRQGLTVPTLSNGDLPPGITTVLIGRQALTLDAPIPFMDKVADGLNVLLFEQEAQVLEQRFGFQVAEHGLRRVFTRQADHPVTKGIVDEQCQDWRGRGTLVPAYLAKPEGLFANPEHEWCGFLHTRVWRADNWGTVCSVAIIKPERGPWTTIYDGGFDLHSAAVLEGTIGKGKIIFCQLDVTGRSESDPVADVIRQRLVAYAQVPSKSSTTTMSVLGKKAQAWAKNQGITLANGIADVVVVSDDAQQDVWSAVKPAGLVVTVGLNEDQLQRLFPGDQAVTQTSLSDAPTTVLPPILRGCSAADLRWRWELAHATLPKWQGCDAARIATIQGRTVVVMPVAPWTTAAQPTMHLRTTTGNLQTVLRTLLVNAGVNCTSRALDVAQCPLTPSRVDLPAAWVGHVDREDRGQKEGWQKSSYVPKGWRPVQVPGMFDVQFVDLDGYDGLFWYRLEFSWPQGFPTEDVTLDIGPVDDESWIWFDDHYLGEVTKQTHPKDYYGAPRRYILDPAWLKADGKHVIIIRCRDTYKNGGLTGQPALSVPGPWTRGDMLRTPVDIDDPYRYYRW